MMIGSKNDWKVRKDRKFHSSVWVKVVEINSILYDFLNCWVDKRLELNWRRMTRLKDVLAQGRKSM